MVFEDYAGFFRPVDALSFSLLHNSSVMGAGRRFLGSRPPPHPPFGVRTTGWAPLNRSFRLHTHPVRRAMEIFIIRFAKLGNPKLFYLNRHIAF